MADKIRMIHKDGRVKLHNKAYAKSEYAAKDGWAIQDPALENDTPVAKGLLGGAENVLNSLPGEGNVLYTPRLSEEEPKKRGRKAKTK